MTQDDTVNTATSIGCGVICLLALALVCATAATIVYLVSGC